MSAGHAVLFSIRRVTSGQSHDDGACGDEHAAEDGQWAELFAEKEGSKDEYENHTKLVQRRDARGWPKLKGAEVAEPGQSGGQTGESQKKQSAPVEFAEFIVLAECDGDDPGEDDNDGGADGGGEVGVHVRDADFGEDGGGGGKERGEQGPENPVHKEIVSRGRPIKAAGHYNRGI